MNKDLSLSLIKAMDVTHINEFQKLISEFSLDSEAQKATISGLLNIMQQGYEETNIRAVKLIGSLKILPAESYLLKIMEDKFNNLRLDELKCSFEKTSLEHQYLTSVLTALILIGSNKGIKIVDTVKFQFNNTWISAYLDEIQVRGKYH